MTSLLFGIVVLAWGFTWYAIRLQLGETPADVSIFWRFALAAGVLWLWLVASGRIAPSRLSRHKWFAGLGMTLFSANFLCFYAAESYVQSGIVSVVFSMATVFNVFNQLLFLGIRPSRRVLLGAALGTLGVALLFANRLAPAGPQNQTAVGIALSLVGTYLFSLGNLVSRQATNDDTSLPNAVARGMAWGAAFLAVGVLGRGESLMPELSITYLSALIYLAVIGSVVGFLAYLSLVARIGPERAAYVTVLSPIIALVLSGLLEGFMWNGGVLLGLPMILLGNIIIFLPSGRAAQAHVVPQPVASQAVDS